MKVIIPGELPALNEIINASKNTLSSVPKDEETQHKKGAGRYAVCATTRKSVFEN
jgi:hypothetical protein